MRAVEVFMYWYSIYFVQTLNVVQETYNKYIFYRRVQLQKPINAIYRKNRTTHGIWAISNPLIAIMQKAL